MNQRTVNNPLEIWEIPYGTTSREYRVLRYESIEHFDTWLCAVKSPLDEEFDIGEYYIRDIEYLGKRVQEPDKDSKLTKLEAASDVAHYFKRLLESIKTGTE